MAYKGEDLDLRTLQNWTSSGREAHDPFAGSLGRLGGGRIETLWVDDVVLAAFNDAYDLALAHRAGEVTIEHFLNAMTRIDAAAKILDVNGVRVAGLRRETATIIASDIPAVFTNGKGLPKTSVELDDLLRLAAEASYARRLPVGVEDMLTALQDSRRDLPGLAVLRRHWSGTRHRETSRLEPLPPLARTFGLEEPRERVRAPARSAYISEPPRNETQQVLTDSLQNTRIEALERLVRDLALDLTSDRKSIGSLFTDIQRDLTAARDDSSRFRGGLSDRFSALEQAVVTTRDQAGIMPGQMADRLLGIERSLDTRFADLARNWTVLGDRLQAIETSVVEGRSSDRNSPVDLTPIDRRMAELQRLMSGFGERLAGLEASVRAGSSTALEPVMDRIAALERSVQGGMGEGARNWAAMGEKLKSLEKVVTAREPAVAVDLSPVVDRMQVLETRLTEAGRTFSQANDRIHNVEELLGAQRSAVGDLTNRLGAEVKSVVTTLAAAQATEDRNEALLTQRLQTLTATVERQRGELVTSLAQPLNERFVAFSSAVDRRQAESGDAVRQVGERLERLEAQLTNVIAKTAETAAMRDKDLIELHEALVKINGNQQSLATSMDQWRLDTTGDLSVVGNRLEAMERAAEQPMALLRQLSGDVQSMHALTLKRESRKSRLRMWLFGTEDWYGDSWGDPGTGRPGAAARVAARPVPQGTVPPTRR